MAKVHPQTQTVAAAQVDAAIVRSPPKLIRHQNSIHLMFGVKKHSIVGVLSGPSICGVVENRTENMFLPIRQMRTYFQQQSDGKITRADSYSDRDVIVGHMDVAHCALAHARTGTTTANAALVQAYDGANQPQICVWSLENILEGEEVILLE
jgi:hypothetical protein